MTKAHFGERAFGFTSRAIVFELTYLAESAARPGCGIARVLRLYDERTLPRWVLPSARAFVCAARPVSDAPGDA